MFIRALIVVYRSQLFTGCPGLCSTTLLIGLAGGGERGGRRRGIRASSVNVFTLPADLLPPPETLIGGGDWGDAGAVGGMLISQIVGHFLAWTALHDSFFQLRLARYLVALFLFIC